MVKLYESGYPLWVGTMVALTMLFGRIYSINIFDSITISIDLKNIWIFGWLKSYVESAKNIESFIFGWPKCINGLF